MRVLSSVAAGILAAGITIGVLHEHRDARSHTERVMGATVLLKSSEGTGSGTVISSRRHHGVYETYILTAAHVVGDDHKLKSISFRYAGDKKVLKQEDEVEVDRIDKVGDLALLHYTRAEPFPDVAPLAASDPAPLSHVITVGSPMGFEPIVTDGMVTDVAVQGGLTYIRESSPSFFGNSGGTLYNDNLELVGVPDQLAGAPITGGFGHIVIPHLAQSIPVSRIRAFLRGIRL